MMQKFSELPYTRPDVAAAVEQYEALQKALSGAETYAQAREAFGNSARSAPAQKTHAGGASVARKTPPFREAIVVFCHKCGNRLAPGSAFCNRCGAQVIGTVPRQDRQ